MSKEKYEKTERTTEEKESALQPDPETLNTTDPQEHMKGPLSSLMQSAKETAEDNGSEEEVEKTKED